MGFSESLPRLLAQPSAKLRKFSELIAPLPDATLEAQAQNAREITHQNFGRTQRLFAPLYLSNECVNNCQYCGFSRDNPILRTTLTPEQVEKEARHLHALGFRNILLVAGEHPKFVSEGYMQECLQRLRPFIPTLGLEVGPMEDEQYRELVDCGAEGLIVYQETYEESIYKKLHTAGPKKNYHWRLDCAERAYMGGFRRIGIGALFGLAPWREEALALAAHIEYLYKHCWKALITVSFPRMRPHAGNYQYTPNPDVALDDRSLVQLIIATRICFPSVGIVLSTREPAPLRDALLPLGVTHLSAGSTTNPGGYTGAGKEDLHRTVRGRRQDLVEEEQVGACSTRQFEIDDERPPEIMAQKIQELGYEPVWKDWDETLLQP